MEAKWNQVHEKLVHEEELVVRLGTAKPGPLAALAVHLHEREPSPRVPEPGLYRLQGQQLAEHPTVDRVLPPRLDAARPQPPRLEGDAIGQMGGEPIGGDCGVDLGYHVRVAVSIPGSYAGLLGELGHLVASLCHIFT